MTDKEKIKAEIERLRETNKVSEDKEYAQYELDVKCGYNMALDDMLSFINFLSKEPISEDLEKELSAYVNSEEYLNNIGTSGLLLIARHFAKWQEKQDQSTIELAEDHAYFAGRTKTIDEIKEALLSEVLPYFMHGGEAEEVVAKLDEVLNQKK